MERYVQFADDVVGLSGETVLEVGGCIHPKTLSPYSPQSWTSIDINPRRFTAVEQGEIPDFFRYERMSVTNMSFPDNSFDIIFSINCFEHIDDIKKALSEMHRVLKPGGSLFSLFGPIWSSPVGHHTYVNHEGTLYHFGNGVFPDWFHLAMDEDGLRSYLNKEYPDDLSAKIVNYVYRSNDLNRMTDKNFIDAINDSQFKSILRLFRKRRGKLSKSLREDIVRKYPDIKNPANTEMLVVLTKDNPTVRQRTRAYTGIAKQGLSKLKKKLNGK